jgi:hypothetical protein
MPRTRCHRSATERDRCPMSEPPNPSAAQPQWLGPYPPTQPGSYQPPAPYPPPAYRWSAPADSAPGGEDAQARPAPPRLPRTEVQRRIRLLRRAIAAGAVLSFGGLIGLAANHSTGVTAGQASPGTNAPQATPTTPAAPDSGGFFNQQPGGFGFGSSGASKRPVSGSSGS